MLMLVAVLIFGVPLFIFIQQSRVSAKTRANRLNEISERLREKKLEEIEAKKKKIEKKNQKKSENK